jgi:hypothetical protein
VDVRKLRFQMIEDTLKLGATNGGDAAYANESCAGLSAAGWMEVRQNYPSEDRPSIQPKDPVQRQRDSAAASAESLESDVLQTPTLEHPNMERYNLAGAVTRSSGLCKEQNHTGRTPKGGQF